MIATHGMFIAALFMVVKNRSNQDILQQVNVGTNSDRSMQWITVTDEKEILAIKPQKDMEEPLMHIAK